MGNPQKGFEVEILEDILEDSEGVRGGLPWGILEGFEEDSHGESPGGVRGGLPWGIPRRGSRIFWGGMGWEGDLS